MYESQADVCECGHSRMVHLATCQVRTCMSCTGFKKVLKPFEYRVQGIAKHIEQSKLNREKNRR